MGGAIVTSFLLSSEHQEMVRGAVLDAPMLDFNATIDLGLRGRGIVRLLGPIGKYMAQLRFGVRWSELDYVSRAGELAVPILLFHGDKDDTVPIETSDALARSRPDIVQYVRCEDTLHVGCWNQNRGLYETALRDFLIRLSR